MNRKDRRRAEAQQRAHEARLRKDAEDKERAMQPNQLAALSAQDRKLNAGWISFDGADVAALQFARGRRLLPEHGG